MDQGLLDKLSGCRDLPTLPAAAIRIIGLAEDPAATMGDVADALGTDPALSAKVLRIANSPLYSRRRQSANLRQAVMLLGLNATLTVALSFSLFSTLKSTSESRLSLDLFWRRSLLAAAAGRVLANETVNTSPEDAFLSSLIQDLGMLALSAVTPGLYTDLAAYQQRDHTYVSKYEVDRLGSDHAEIGAWLLSRWQFPRHLSEAVAQSHVPDELVDDSSGQPVSRCVALSGLIADFFLLDEGDEKLSDVLTYAKQYWDIGDDWIDTVRDNLSAVLPELEALFEMKILDAEQVQSLSGEAREALIVRNLHSQQQLEELHRSTDSIRRQAVALEERSRRDDLTGLINRGALDETIARDFQQAVDHNWPLSVIFIDLDHFKTINDTHGHHTGDDALRLVSAVLTASVRSSEVVGRYGGEEFLIIAPGTDSISAQILGDRLLEAIRETKLTADTGAEVALTISAGIATHATKSRYADSEALIRSADRSMFEAKRQGRDRLVVAEPPAS